MRECRQLALENGRFAEDREFPPWKPLSGPVWSSSSANCPAGRNEIGLNRNVVQRNLAAGLDVRSMLGHERFPSPGECEGCRCRNGCRAAGPADSIEQI